MPMPGSPTVYFFVNKDGDSLSLSRSHGKDASAILSHVQSCRNQKNKQLHMFRIESSSDSASRSDSRSSSKSASPVQSLASPSSPTAQAASRRTSRHTTPPKLRSELSSSSDGFSDGTPHYGSDSVRHSPTAAAALESSPEVDELLRYFDSLAFSSMEKSSLCSSPDDLFHLIVSSQRYFHHSREIVGDIHAYSVLALTAARMSADIPARREEFEIKATKYMQPSLFCLRSQLANLSTRTLTDRQILVEMLLHCVTNWYLHDLTAAQTHLNAIDCFTRCLDASESADRTLMDIIHRCSTGILAQKTAQSSPSRQIS